MLLCVSKANPTVSEPLSLNIPSTERSATDMSSSQGRLPLIFEDFFPVMVEKLGADGFMKELSNGFGLLVDRDKGVITFESLKRNLALLGLQGMSDEEVRSMLREGDLDGDGALDENEFCVLMLRLSPQLMKDSRELLKEMAMGGSASA
ncbi:hypothetical protein SAY87_031282 [Trapa incisa]|uniref:EF-hand domain-containing protein n=1 Tax=Trapa incisa TaxID=236973 RepID=A0AAN7QPE7_9MYRT|nr:hypothetical protein SAY87_031282 [Trapa incisa]